MDKRRTFIEVAWDYEEKFKKNPPIFATLDEENELYLDMLEKAIKEGKELTRDDLANVFVIHEKATY